MNFRESAVAFPCGSSMLVGIISRPEQPGARGVLVVVGGPQYRAGSHRQFTLICRALAGSGVAAMRFDFRGMGDSEGDARDFEDVLPDIRAAVDAFCAGIPQLREVAILGLCDGASAALFYAHRDARIRGLALINPWVRTESGLARTQLKHYYLARLADPEFWRRVAAGEFPFRAAAGSFAGAMVAALGGRRARGANPEPGCPSAGAAAPLPERMAEGLQRFGGRVLLILSGRDLTAREFGEVARASRRWRKLLSAARVEHRQLPEADHTFSRREWRDQVTAWTAAWVRSW